MLHSKVCAAAGAVTLIDSMLVTSTCVSVSLLSFSASFCSSLAIGRCSCGSNNAVALFKKLPDILHHNADVLKITFTANWASMQATGTNLTTAHTSRPIPLFAPTTTICLSVMALAVVMDLFKFLLICAGPCCICALNGVPVLNAEALLPSMFDRVHSYVNVVQAKLLNG